MHYWRFRYTDYLISWDNAYVFLWSQLENICPQEIVLVGLFSQDWEAECLADSSAFWREQGQNTSQHIISLVQQSSPLLGPERVWGDRWAAGKHFTAWNLSRATNAVPSGSFSSLPLCPQLGGPWPRGSWLETYQNFQEDENSLRKWSEEKSIILFPK